MKRTITRWESLEAFYDAEPLRRLSSESNYGVWWRDKRPFPRFRVSYIEATGEIYAVALTGEGCTELLGQVQPDEGDHYYRTLDSILEGWADRCDSPDGLAWLRERLAEVAA